MEVGDRLQSLAAAQVGVHGVTLDGAGPDDGDLDHQIVEFPRLGLVERLLLGSELDLEEADGVDRADHVVDARVVEREGVEVGTDAVAPLDQVQALGDGGEGAQPQQVHLDETEILDVVLVELDHHPALHGGALHRDHVDQRLAGDQHPADVDGEMPGRALDGSQDLEELPPRQGPAGGVRLQAGRLQGVLHPPLSPAVDGLGQPVDDRLGEAHRLAHLAHRETGLEGDHVGDHPGPLRPVLVVDVLDHLLAVVGGEVDVDVRRPLVVDVEEALEEEVVGDRVHPGDAEQVGDDRVGGAAPPLAGDAVLPGPRHDLVDDQEELGQIGPLDDVELHLQPPGHLGGERPVAEPDLVLAEPVEDGEGGLPGGDGEAGEADPGEVEVEAAPGRELGGVLEGAGEAGEPPAQHGLGEQAVLAVGEEQAVGRGPVEGGPVADGGEHVEQRLVVAGGVDGGGAGDQGEAGPLGQLGDLGGQPAVGGVEVVGEQEGGAVPTEAFAQPFGLTLGSAPVAGDEGGDHGALRSPGEGDAVVEVGGVHHRRRALHPLPGRGERWPALGERTGGGAERLRPGGRREEWTAEARGCFAAVRGTEARGQCLAPPEVRGGCFAPVRASARPDRRSAPLPRQHCICCLRQTFAAHAPPHLLFRRVEVVPPGLDLSSRPEIPAPGPTRRLLLPQPGDAQPGLALDPGELGGADRPAELAVATPAAGQQPDPASVDQVQLDPHHRPDAGLAGSLDEADRPVEPVAVAEAEAPDLQPGGDLDQIAGRGRALQEGEVGAGRQLGEGRA